uniref:Uncharacterized protein n=1 Tax=Amphiprion percula TaxID=161767 RepID=A0A3P8RRV5_AMPPE
MTNYLFLSPTSYFSEVRWLLLLKISLVAFIFCHIVVLLIFFFLRLDELRHRLIPMYTYDPAEEQDDWGNAGRDNEEELTHMKWDNQSNLSLAWH